MPLDALTPYLTAVLIAFAGGFFRGFAGFGSGLLMAPLLTLLYPPSVVVGVLVILALTGDVRLLPEVRREVDRVRVAWLAGPALLGIPLGIWVLTAVEPETVRRVVNLVVLGLVVALARGVRKVHQPHPRALAAAGLISGTLTGVGGIGGPPVVLTFLALGEPPARSRANLIAFFAVTGLAALGMLLASGVFEAESAKLAALCALPYSLAVHLGSRRFRTAKASTYRPVALTFLGCVALFGLIW